MLCVIVLLMIIDVIIVVVGLLLTSTSPLSYPVPRNRERSLHTCAQDVQITRMATI
jgi:hypothetical protein